MKLRTAYFCRKCDEEIDIETLDVKRKCPYCEYEPDWGKTSVVYQWKVPDIRFKKIIEETERYIIYEDEKGNQSADLESTYGDVAHEQT